MIVIVCAMFADALALNNGSTPRTATIIPIKALRLKMAASRASQACLDSAL